MLKWYTKHLIILILSLFFPQTESKPTSTPLPSPYYYYHQINPQDRFLVIPNFQNPQDSNDIIKNNSCKYAINGGLYQENNRPLGLFIHDNKIINKKISSHIFNGFLFLNDNVLNIGQTNSLNSSFAMQTGPYFDLSLPSPNYNEKTARRHVIAKDQVNNLYIFSIFTPQSTISGPTLEQIPEFFQKPEIQKIANFTEVLTLDGGSASVFFSPTDSIHETSFIGSLLCWR